jgi:uncharacterized protein YdhG (YjbR/CyaY superfamily)
MISEGGGVMAEVDEYLSGLDEPERGILSAIVSRARELVASADEGMSYGMPALRYRGRPLVSVTAAKAHLSLFPFSPAVVEAVAGELEGYSLSKGTIRFGVERPLPAEVVTRVVELRRAEIDAALDR